MAALNVDAPLKAPAARTATEDTSIRPFQVHVLDEALADLRRRIQAAGGPMRRPSPISRRAEAVSVFPGEQYEAPRSWAERAYPKLFYYHRADRGGHFAAWEQPQLFATEVRAGFKSLR